MGSNKTEIANEEDRRKTALLRIKCALEHLYNAQCEIGRARQELYALIGLIPENDKLSKIHDAMRTAYYKLSDRSVEIAKHRRPRNAGPEFGLLDHSPEPHEHKAHTACGQVRP